MTLPLWLVCRPHLNSQLCNLLMFWKGVWEREDTPWMLHYCCWFSVWGFSLLCELWTWLALFCIDFEEAIESNCCGTAGRGVGLSENLRKMGILMICSIIANTIRAFYKLDQAEWQMCIWPICNNNGLTVFYFVSIWTSDDRYLKIV